ncbi:LOW QUALITY PROTEIN: uncharacterized protein LOC105432385 [Pogonomyrmex barbatus]|uniref:LOW QUALITY PROTEIN: uncharacterized protein LOC105432385 n=1 Tax=Pogonomyrmex barbatus TaxID=144034 RepID=A0A6I9WPC3_9HYME|nr:LOW QUALITY PROTEIN: uncharacterized protein LOC105432385 [Pogonomyrmex barbatus]
MAINISRVSTVLLRVRARIIFFFWFQLIPLVCVQTCVLLALPLMIYHRLFVTTIDVQLTDYQRFEIPSKPRFIDLRNPRSLKLITITKPKPAIHLDNRYRLMRHEPMLDADGNVTDKIGDDYY